MNLSTLFLPLSKVYRKNLDNLFENYNLIVPIKLAQLINNLINNKLIYYLFIIIFIYYYLLLILFII